MLSGSEHIPERDNLRRLRRTLFQANWGCQAFVRLSHRCSNTSHPRFSAPPYLAVLAAHARGCQQPAIETRGQLITRSLGHCGDEPPQKNRGKRSIAEPVTRPDGILTLAACEPAAVYQKDVQPVSWAPG